MIAVPKTYGQWAKTLVATIITSAANAALASLGITGANLMGIKVPALDFRQVGAIMLSGGFVGALAYLAKNPVPTNGDITDNETKTP